MTAWRCILILPYFNNEGARRSVARRRRRSALSLVETAIVLGVVGIVIGGVWVIAASSRENTHRQAAIQQIATVVDGVRTFYKSKAAMEASPVDKTDYLVRKSAIPLDMVRDHTVSPLLIDNPWGAVNGGGLRVLGNAPDLQTFVVMLRGLKQDSCVAMATRVGDSTGMTGLLELHINGGGALTQPVSIPSALSGCSFATNYIEYVFRLRAPVT